ncbi:MAG: M3 family oligoendopeptidase, partial [Nitrospiraceae bacterium]
MPLTNASASRPSAGRITRQAVPARWDLSHLMQGPEDFDECLQALEKNVSKFESSRAGLSATISPDVLGSLLELNEEISTASSKIGAYAYLWYSENTKNLQARSFKSKVEERLTALQNRLLFFELWWQGVDEANATRLLSTSGDLRYHLETIRRFTPHTLSEPEEQILNVKNVTGRSAVNQLYDVLTTGFTFTLTVKGTRRALNREELTAQLRSSVPRAREAAYRELYRVFSENHDVIGEIYKTLVNDWKAENMQLRKFSTAIATRNLGNDVPDQAVVSLLSVCT